MGIYFRPAPWVKVQHTRRGWRVGLGPRWCRVWLGGRPGVSTGAGPFSAYKPLRKRKRFPGGGR